MIRINNRKCVHLCLLTFALTCLILIVQQENEPYSNFVQDSSLLRRVVSSDDRNDFNRGFYSGRSLDGLKPERSEQDLVFKASEGETGRSYLTGATAVTPNAQVLSSTTTQAPAPTERSTDLTDFFISVKTTKKFHRDRVALLLDTWGLVARDQTYYFTDADDQELSYRTNGRIINTNCSQGHNRRDLCCKMAFEFDYFIQSRKRWFCHVDDDTYLNVRRLVQVLRRYNPARDWYLGKPSLGRPIEMEDKDRPGNRLSFWFATGGAGFCISRALAVKMTPHTGGGRLRSVCEKIRLPDDCSMGYIINHLLKVELTQHPDFHSHLEGLGLLTQKRLNKHITISYAPYGKKMNVVNIEGFNLKKDPTRFRSVHCKLYPYLNECKDVR